MSRSKELVFDPDQNPDEVRGLRQNYRELASTIEEYQSNPTGLNIDELRHRLETADKLFEKVKGTSEAALDSHFLLMASNMGAQKARALKSGTGSFDVDEYLKKLRNFMSGGLKNLPTDEDGEESAYSAEGTRMDWDRIGRLALAKSRRVPALTFMVGPLSIEHKTRNIAKRARLEKDDVKETRPEQLKENDMQTTSNETTKNVQLLKAILDNADEDRINVFKFVINPHDYAQTVENIFHLSFLVKDGIVAWEVEDGEPVIYTCDRPTDEDYENGLKKRAFMYTLSEDDWRAAIEIFDIKKPMIPQRPRESGIANGSKWYA